jgi:hypothetical protein
MTVLLTPVNVSAMDAGTTAEAIARVQMLTPASPRSSSAA